MNEKDKAQMDWQQVALNGGPPCFFVEGPQYCGRAERWPGHGNEAFHKFVSLDDLLATARKEAGEAALKSGRQAFAAELLGHLDRVTSTTAAFHLIKNLCKIELGQEPDSLGVKVE